MLLGKPLNNLTHLKAAVDWLLLASAKVNYKGFSAAYSLINGWGDAYPETTGYIIPTLLNFANFSDYKKKYILKSCLKSGEWLLQIQNKDGWFTGYCSNQPFVFDTGQIIFGLIALYKHTNEQKYINAAIKAASWLVENQEKDGSWVKYALHSRPHTYYCRVAWGLLEVYKLTSEEEFKEAAVKNLDWTIGQQLENGWFNNFGFFQDSPVVLHTIAYTLQGLLESGIILKKDLYIQSAKKTADILLGLNVKKLLRGFYDENWQLTTNSLCLTGLAQTGIIWLRLGEEGFGEKYNHDSKNLAEYLIRRQQKINWPSIKGALAGSYPIWGKYQPFSFPNWSVKFFIDFIMFLEQQERGMPALKYPG